MARYTEITVQDVDALLGLYDIGVCLNLSPMDGGQANSSVRVTTRTGVYILSVCDEKNVDEISSLTEVLVYLEECGFPTSRVIRNRQGGLFVTFHDKPVYIKSYIQGQVVRSLSPGMLGQVGRAMATLHSLPPMTGMTNAFPYGFGAIDELLDLPMVHPYLDWLKPRKVFLDAAIDRTMPRGFIHGDLFWDNLVFDGDSLAAVLDFEEACHYYLLFDLGMCVVGCCSERGKLDIDRIRHLVGGYQACRQMTGKEHSQMVPFMEYAAVVASLWRFRQYTIRRPDPEKADSYQELSVLAEQIRELDMSCLI